MGAQNSTFEQHKNDFYIVHSNIVPLSPCPNYHSVFSSNFNIITSQIRVHATIVFLSLAYLTNCLPVHQFLRVSGFPSILRINHI